MSRSLRWILVGASDIAATRVIPAMRVLGHEPVALLSGNRSHAIDYAKRHGIHHVAESLDQAMSVDADAVYVSSRNDQHRLHAVAALQAGRHLLCEKPLGTTLEDAAAIIDAADATDLVLATHHHLRGSPVIRTVQGIVQRGELGRLLAIRMNHAVDLPPRLRGWRLESGDVGGGVVLDITVHDADALRFITGREICAVTAHGANQGLAAAGVSDAVMSVFSLEDEVLAFAHDAYTVPHAGTSLEVHGTEGSLFASDAMTQDPDGGVVLQRGRAQQRVAIESREDLYVTGLRAFTKAVAGEGQPLASGRDGYASLAAALAVAESIRMGQSITVASTPGRPA